MGRVLVDERGEVLRYESDTVAAGLSIFNADGSAWMVRIEYRNRRRFEASTAVTYGPGN